jgi:hypothetical protein
MALVTDSNFGRNILAARIFKGGDMILKTGIINSIISIAGNPGIGGTLFLPSPSGNEIDSIAYVDNFIVREAL